MTARVLLSPIVAAHISICILNSSDYGAARACLPRSRTRLAAAQFFVEQEVDHRVLLVRYDQEVRQLEEEEEEEESSFKANAVNGEDPERDRAPQV